MPDSTDGNEEREQQLDAIIAEYYRSIETGRAPKQNEFIAQHPDFRQELREFFADLRMFQDSNHRDSDDPALEATITPGTTHRKNLAAGAVVRYFGAYEILEELGSGGMGVVYKARHARLRKLVALKMIRARELATEFEVRMFEAEARAAAKLDHPNIVAVHEVGVHADQHFYSMDYVAGGSLSSLHRDEPVPARRAAELVRQLAEAIHYAHGQGIVHRDLKPANILLTTDGVPRVTDFGLAKRLWAGEDSVALSMTETGRILGTAGYMSPEQAEGKTTLVGPPADIYALGAVLYALLTSRAPFIGESQADTIRQVIDKEPVSLRVLNPALPRDLETICLKCLNKEPYERYGTAQLLADDLTAFLDGRPIAARPIGYIGRTAKWIRRHRLVSSLLLLTCVSMLMGTVFSVHFGITAGQEAVKADKARTEATQSLAEVELSDYLNRIALAQTEWQADNVKGCEELLDACPVHLRGWEWNYLKRLCHTGPVTTIRLKTGADGLSGLAYSSDSTRIFTKDHDSLDAWDANTGRHIISRACDGGGSFAYDATRNNILVGKRLIDGTSFEEVVSSNAIGNSLHNTGFSKATFSHDGALLAGALRTGDTSAIRILNPDSGGILFELPETEGGTIHSLAFSPSAAYLAVGREDVIQVWALDVQELVFSEPGGGLYVTFDKSGGWLIAGAAYHGITGNPLSAPDIRIWKVPAFQLIRTLTTDSGGAINQRMGGVPYMGIWGPVAGTHSIAACPSNQKLGVLSWDRSIRVFDLDTLVESEERRGRAHRSLNDRVLILDPVPELTRLRGGHLGQPTALAFDPAGSRLATADTMGTLQIWDISHPQEARRYASSVRPANANDPEFQFGDSTIAIDSEILTDDQAKFGVTQTTRGTQLIDLMGGSVSLLPQAVRLSKDGRMLATVVADRLHVRSVLDQKDALIIDDVFELDSAPPLRTPPSFSLDASGRRLAVQSKGHLIIWDVVSKRQLCDIAPASHGSFSDENVSVNGIFDPTGQRVATFVDESGKDVICIWDVSTARLVAKACSKEICNDLFLGEDRLITVGRDQLTCWLLPIPRAPSALPLEQKIMTASWTYQFDLSRKGQCFVSDDFTRIVFAGGPTTLIVIDACTGKVVTTMMVQENIGDPVHISPDGSRFVATTVDGQLHLHHIDGNRDVLDLGFPEIWRGKIHV